MSSYASSNTSRRESVAGRPQIIIALKDQEDSWVATFSTLDKIEGMVYVTCPVNTPIEDITINFIGRTKTSHERLTSSTMVSGRSEASHQFLRLAQPISSTALPQDRILEAGKTYEFEFLFVVPHQLLPRVCRHSTSGSTVHEEHTKLPPSFGDKSVAGRGNTLLDDLSPEMSRISYAITATLLEPKKSDAVFSHQPVSESRKVRILPATEENPPITTEGPTSDYVMRVEKDIRKGMFKGKLGRLVVEAVQPKALRIPSHLSDSEAPESTFVTVNARFDPVDENSTYPSLGSVNSRLKVNNFFATCARSSLPSKNDTRWDLSQGLHVESINLASRCMGNTVWDWNPDNESTSESLRRSSVLSSSSGLSIIPEPSKKYRGKGYWTASIVVPISLPTCKAWIPTFHTCLVSRTYSLGIHVGLNSGGLGSGMDLKLPIQLTSEGNPASLVSGRASLSAQEQAFEAMAADDFFAPRTISPLHASLAGRSSIGHRSDLDSELPPEYNAFSSSRNRAIAVA
ncbi:hypothetical protein ANO11243_010960 [Dothideomycetidae sp. 11243]|nr:hypothetical protein ANO11243_010960 [fungal sp. No.11243]